jgi:prepilin-type N-terminal cleavage/methylation domain-containing protein
MYLRDGDNGAGPPRAGFTLIEMVVVIALALVLTALVAFVIPSSNTRAASNGADRLQGWLLVAKQRALRDRLPRGLRLVDDGTSIVTQLQYVEVPDPFVPPQGSSLRILPPGANLAPIPANAQSYWVADLTTGAYPADGGLLQEGDYIDITDDTNVRRIAGPNTTPALVTYLPPQQYAASPGVLPFTRYALVSTPMGLTTNSLTVNTGFRFVRGAQPIMGDPVLTMPKGSGIAYVNTDNQGLPNSVWNYQFPMAGSSTSAKITDIIFAPGGQVITPGVNGAITLWVYDTTQTDPTTGGPDPNLGSNSLVNIYHRTGKIGAFPINRNLNPALGPTGYYIYTRDGKAIGAGM